MWMDETIGQRINENRTDEALSLQPDIVTAACPFCVVMLTDGVNLRQQQGQAPENVEVLDISELLQRSTRTVDALPLTAPTAEGTSL